MVCSRPAVPPVTTLLASSKDTDPPSTFVASPLPPLRLKGLPTPVQPAATGAEEKASVISLGPTSTSSGSVLPDSVAEGGVGGGDEEAMEETGAHICLCSCYSVCIVCGVMHTCICFRVEPYQYCIQKRCNCSVISDVFSAYNIHALSNSVVFSMFPL